MSSDTAPLTDTRAERAVLGAILLDPDRLVDIRDILRPEDFYTDAHRAYYSAMLSLDGPVDFIRVAGRLRDLGARDFAADLSMMSSEVPVGLNVVHHADRVRALAALRSLRASAQRIAVEAGSADAIADPAAAALKAHDALSSALKPLTRGAQRNLGCMTMRELAELAVRSLQSPTGAARKSMLGFGVPSLDALCQMERGLLTVIAGRPGNGKSALGLQVHAHLGRPDLDLHPYLHWLEDTDTIAVARLLAQQSNVPLARVKDLFENGAHGETGSSDVGALVDVAGRLAGLTGTVDDTGKVGMAWLKTAIRQKADAGCKVSILDHGLRVKRDRKAGETRDQVSDVITEYEDAIKSNDLWGLMLTQLHRIDGNRRPTVSDLKETGTFEENARLVILCWRPEPDISCAPGCLIVAKNNHGPTGECWLIFDGPHVLWREPRTASEVAQVAAFRARYGAQA